MGWYWILYSTDCFFSFIVDGVIGLGIAATAVGLIAGGIAAAVSRKKWQNPFYQTHMIWYVRGKHLYYCDFAASYCFYEKEGVNNNVYKAVEMMSKY